MSALWCSWKYSGRQWEVRNEGKSREWFFFSPNRHVRVEHIGCCAEARYKGSKTGNREIRCESILTIQAEDNEILK